MSDAPREIGPFEILALLGRGGMGVVYRARHAASGEVVALKTVRVPDPDLVSGIRREVRALSRLDHPGIVRIVAEGIHEGIPWYAMQHLSGQTLSRHAATDACVAPTLPLEAPARPGTAAEPRARATPRFSRGHALTLVRRLCSPLAYLHGEGFVHKDLKPDNVLVLGSGAPVILDFGLTDPFNAAREELSVSSAAVGTAPYMAPEQAVAGRLDARADLYSLGCILFELLTGRPPFLGDPAAILFQHLTVVPPKASSLAPDVPAGVDAIVARLLAKEPADRFGYASDVASALARAGAENGVYGGAPRGRTYLYHPGFAGRDDEIRIVKSALRSPQSAYRAVLLVGESGAGKTRLASEVARRIADAGQMVMAGQCASDDPAPLRGFQGILRTIGDGCRGGGQKEVERVLGPHAKLLSAFEPSLATLPGVPEQPDPPSLPEAASRARLLHALQKVLGAVEEGGLLLVIDDVQWADDLTLLATESLLDGKAAVRILALCREEEETDGIRALAGHPCALRVRVGRLCASAIGDVCKSMLAVADPAPSVVAQVDRASAGNPLFAAEYLRAAVHAGLLTRDQDGRWLVPAAIAGELPLPRTVLELLEERLARLSASGAELAGVASIAGKEMESSVLAAASTLSETAALDALAELIAARILEAEGPRVSFTHDKVREAALARLSAVDAAAIHLRVAEVLDRSSGASAALLETIAAHFEQGGDRARALDRRERAGRAHLSRGLAADGVRCLELVARALPPAGERTRAIALDLAELMENLGRWKDGPGWCTVADQALPAPCPRAANLRARFHLLTGDLAPASRHAERALSDARALGEGSEASYALNVLGNVALASGDPATARARYGEALESARAIASPRWIAGSLMNFGFLAFQLSLHDEAQEHWDAALALFMASGEALMATRVRGNLAFLELTRGRHAQARDLIAAMLPVLQESGDVAALAPAHLNMGRALAGLDDPDGALSHYTKAIDSACEMGNRPIEGSALLGRARVVAARGRLDEAREDLRASLAALSSSARTEATDLVQLAETLRAAGLHDEALACAARLSEQLGGVPAMARAAMRLRGEALEDKGDLSGAIEAYSELRDLAARGSAGDEASYASRAIDRCRAAGGSDLTNPGQPSS